LQETTWWPYISLGIKENHTQLLVLAFMKDKQLLYSILSIGQFLKEISLLNFYSGVSAHGRGYFKIIFSSDNSF